MDVFTNLELGLMAIAFTFFLANIYLNCKNGLKDIDNESNIKSLNGEICRYRGLLHEYREMIESGEIMFLHGSGNRYRAYRVNERGRLIKKD